MNKDKSTIQALKIDSSSISMAISPAEKAELLSMQFAKNSSLDEGGQNPPLSTGETVSPPSFTVKRVNKIISCLDSSKSSGPDGIPAIVFNHLSPELSPVDPVQNFPEMCIHQRVSFLLKSCFICTHRKKSFELYLSPPVIAQSAFSRSPAKSSKRWLTRHLLTFLNLNIFCLTCNMAFAIRDQQVISSPTSLNTLVEFLTDKGESRSGPLL